MNHGICRKPSKIDTNCIQMDIVIQSKNHLQSILDITIKLGGNFYIRCIEIRSIENPIQKH
ncbi:hypothetical protein BpHYR1_030391 [Brachionus plicatilis]|uniref:Uncharacterized protein n=1 Tax=Brachionus plicatilis TaxID=10195 RepID=A0A3M7QN44_BRAPC|nr:hypothetical protein BpHYR1_030391 [Brachionus plicatilis]